MTTRGQNLRSSTTGATPAAGTRLPGEMFVNFADLQLGTIDASKNAQRLIAVRYFSTGANYAIGDYVVQGGQLYQAAVAITAGAFNIGQWVKSATVSDITTALAGSTGDNRIINGDMRIDQRNNGAIVSAVGYTVDRWGLGASVASKLTVQRNPAGAGTAAIGFGYFLTAASLSAYTPAASDAFQIYQRIEADMISDFAFGTPNAQAVTLSFWAQSTLTGTFSGSLANDTPTRTYPFTYSIPTANTWTKIAVTIPGDTAGTWVLSGNALGAVLRLDLGAGATFRGPAGAWASSNYLGATGSVSLVATNAATFYVTGVKLEIGSVATPFNRQSLAKSMADCQRYYQNGVVQVQYTIGATGQLVTTMLPFPVWMRAAPTMTPNFSTQAGATGAFSNISAPAYGFNCTNTSAVGTQATVYGNWTASAEL